MTTTRSRRTRRDEPARRDDREQRHEHEEREHQHEAAGDVRHPRSAAEKCARHNSSHLHLPIVGEIELPAKDELAYIGGLTVLGIVGVVEWPVAVLLALGHALIANRRNKVVREFGEALEEA